MYGDGKVPYSPWQIKVKDERKKERESLIGNRENPEDIFRKSWSSLSAVSDGFVSGIGDNKVRGKASVDTVATVLRVNCELGRSPKWSLTYQTKLVCSFFVKICRVYCPYHKEKIKGKSSSKQDCRKLAGSCGNTWARTRSRRCGGRYNRGP